MPVTKYRSVEEMPSVMRVQGDALIPRIRALWNRSFLLSPPDYPKGVLRFRSIEEANAARDAHTARRMRARSGG